MRGQTVSWTSMVAVLGFFVPPAHSQAVNTAQNQTIRISGIFSGSLYAQDADFGTGNGQRAEYVTVDRDDWEFSGDVRNFRLTLSVNGPEVRRGWRANGTFEIDFFGAFVGTGNFSDEQPEPRLRLAYVDLTNGRTTLRVGQAWSLTLGNIPQSTSHIGFPLGWGSGGFIGWRFPGAWFITTLSPANAPTSTRLSIGVMRNSWTDEPVPDNFSAGERGSPQLEARFDRIGRNSSFYVVGHMDSKDTPTFTSWAVQIGGNLTRGDLSLNINGHVGSAMGHHFAQILQFGEITGWGAWGQIGYNLNPRWSIWGFYGTERPNETDINDAGIVVTEANGTTVLAPAARRLSSWLFVPMLRYRSGPFSYGLEWLHNEVELGSGALVTGNQIAASVRYDF